MSTKKNRREADQVSSDLLLVITVVSLFFFFPIGIVFMWMWMKWPLWAKMALTIIPVICLVLMVGLSWMFFTSVILQPSHPMLNGPMLSPGQ